MTPEPYASDRMTWRFRRKAGIKQLANWWLAMVQTEATDRPIDSIQNVSSGMTALYNFIRLLMLPKRTEPVVLHKKFSK